MKILIVEDTLIMQDLYKDLLTELGHEVDFAANGQEAVELAQLNGAKYDLCLMDVRMPVMDGIEATRIIRRGDYYFPIAACTSELNLEEACMQAGMDAFFVKPLSICSLRKLIDELTVKQVILYLDGSSLSLQWIKPTDGDELKVFRMLAEKNLTKYTVVDATFSFIAHKCAQNKLIQDLNVGGSFVSEIVDRSSKKPGVVRFEVPHIEFDNYPVTQEQVEQLIKDEDSVLMGMALT